MKKFQYDFPLFRHLDFSTVSKTAIIFKCSKCQTISNPCAEKTELPTFEKKKYANSLQTRQTMHVDGYTEPVTRSFLQAKMLTE